MNDIQTVMLQASDAEYVVSHPWEVSADELSAFGFSPEQSRQAVSAIWARSAYAYALRHENETVAIMGGYQLDDGQWKTWFLASDKFPGLGKQVIKTVRGLFEQFFNEHGNVKVVATTASRHPAAPAWFKMIGFNREPGYDYQQAGREFHGYVRKE